MFEEEYVHEERVIPDGMLEELIKTRDGVIVCKITYDSRRREIERLTFQDDGTFSGRVVKVYEEDTQIEPLKATMYDADNEVICVKERSKPLVYYGKYKAMRENKAQ